MPEITDADDPLPVFIPEWSVWDIVITHHYEKVSMSAKNFMYALLQKRASASTELAYIPTELYEALKGAFRSRPAFGFLIENGATVEQLPELFTKMLPHPLPHEVTVFYLAFWKMMNFRDVYIVTEDKDFKKILKQMNQVGIKFANLKIINCKESNMALVTC